MASLLHLRPKECRAPETEVLPDNRKRLTRFFEVATTAEIPPELNLAWGTLDDFPQANLAADWQGLRLTNRKLTDDVPQKGRDPRPILQLVYETIAAAAETPVGNVDTTKLEDGRTAKVQSYLQFSTGAYAPETVGTFYAPYGYLLKEEAPDDGTLRRIKRTYVTAGTIKQVDLQKNNGALLLRTITSVQTVPATPGGYVLVDQDVQSPLGLPTYTYTFAKGTGEISRNIEYRLSIDTGATGMTVTTIKYLSAPGVVSNPITPPVGTATIEDDHEDLDGYRLWTGIYAKGTGTVISNVTLQNKGKLVVYAITALGAAPTAPTPTIGGTVELIESSVRQDRFHQGVLIYEYRWVEGNGQVKVKVTGRGDGSLEYTVREFENGITTPAYPGAGTAYLVDLDNEAAEGHYVNTATYIKPPATVTLKKIKNFKMPGLASFSGTDLLITPPNERVLEADEEISYDVLQNTDVPYKVDYGAYLRMTYVRTNNNSVGEYKNEALGYILAAASGISSGTPGTFNGMACDSYTAILNSSSPTARPSGPTVIDKDNSIYLVSVTGVIVYRRVKVSYTF